MGAHRRRVAGQGETLGTRWIDATGHRSFFPNNACTTALIDRLVHHSEIISIEGESYLKREATLAKEATETRRRKKRS